MQDARVVLDPSSSGFGGGGVGFIFVFPFSFRDSVCLDKVGGTAGDTLAGAIAEGGSGVVLRCAGAVDGVGADLGTEAGVFFGLAEDYPGWS
ncbi:hypothetical protein V6N13_001661 [Hibiscus sabdariffa]|uniref:Uncharacterized protein n=1 Tax=Hibiscus sabdariffa TaxID=183260 RepID=A0ABR2GAE3_9ROSI